MVRYQAFERKGVWAAILSPGESPLTGERLLSGTQVSIGFVVRVGPSVEGGGAGLGVAFTGWVWRDHT